MEEFILKHAITIVMCAILLVIVGICILTSDANMGEERIEQIIKYDEMKSMRLI